MAEISFDYKDTIHTIHSYDEIINTYGWIKDATQLVFQDRDDLSINCGIAFISDEISYKCCSIEEFKKHAFGKNITSKYMWLSIRDKEENPLIFIHATNFKDCSTQEFSITSEDEMLLIKFKETLDIGKISTSMQKDAVILKYEDNSIRIGNDNQISNASISSKNTFAGKQIISKAESNKETVFSKFFWNVIVAIAVGVIIAIICRWFEIIL